jgi:L-lactate dehydrogenase complex protein LldF
VTVLSPTANRTTDRDAADAALRDLDSLHRAAGAVRRHVLGDLPELLERFADQVLTLGGHVCWAATAAEARHYIASVVVRHNASQVLRSTPPTNLPARPTLSPITQPGRSPLAANLPAPPPVATTEEIDVDQLIASCHADVVETDLATWIDELADGAPSHIAAAAPQRDRGHLRELLVKQACAPTSLRRRPGELVSFARERLRDQFFGAEVGVGAAELAVAETGSVVLLDDQANSRLAAVLPQVHVVLLGIDQLAARWDQADLLLALRGQAARENPVRETTTTTVLTGPRHGFELDGPRELHVVVLDNGRSSHLAQLARDASPWDRRPSEPPLAPSPPPGGHIREHGPPVPPRSTGGRIREHGPVTGRGWL